MSYMFDLLCVMSCDMMCHCLKYICHQRNYPSKRRMHYGDTPLVLLCAGLIWRNLKHIGLIWRRVMLDVCLVVDGGVVRIRRVG